MHAFVAAYFNAKRRAEMGRKNVGSSKSSPLPPFQGINAINAKLSSAFITREHCGFAHGCRKLSVRRVVRRETLHHPTAMCWLCGEKLRHTRRARVGTPVCEPNTFLSAPGLSWFQPSHRCSGSSLLHVFANVSSICTSAFKPHWLRVVTNHTKAFPPKQRSKATAFADGTETQKNGGRPTDSAQLSVRFAV